MDLYTIFWEHIALDLEQSYKNGHPSVWKKAKIEAFLYHFEERLVRICKANAQKAELFKLEKNQNNSYQYNSLKIPSYSTFLRIFKDKVSTGKINTRNQFAIYLGYESSEDYVNKRNIKERAPLEEEISFDQFILEHSPLDGLIDYIRQLQENFSNEIYLLLKRLNHRIQKAKTPDNAFGLTFFAPALKKNELDEAYCLLNFNNRLLDDLDLNQCLKSIEKMKKCEWDVFSYTLICNAQFNTEQYEKLKSKASELITEKVVEYTVNVLDVESFVKQCMSLIRSTLRDQIISANQKYETDYKKRMGQQFYIKRVPFTLNENRETQHNPLVYLTQNHLKKDEEWELMELLKDFSLEEKRGSWSFVISEFGFGKTSLLLNIFKLLQEKNINALFIPIAQLPEKSFQNPDFFCRAILNILHNKIYTDSQADSLQFAKQYLDFHNQKEIFVELMVKDFKTMLMTRSDIVFLFDGLDENYIAYSHKGLKKIFNCIQPFKVKCFFSVREEFWYDKQGNFQLALNEEFAEKIFLKEWNDEVIGAFIEKQLEQVSPHPSIKSHLKHFKNLVEHGEYQKYYGDIPKRPLFLNMLTQDVVKGDIQKKNLSELYESYLQKKFRFDLERAFAENTELQPIKLLSEEDAAKVLRKIFIVLTRVSSLMIFNSETFDAILISDTTEERIEHMVGLLKEKTFSITEILLNSVLIPIHKRQSFDNFRVKFAHKSFQEYFTARYLFELIKNPGGEQRDYDLFRYKFDESIIRFLVGILESEKRHNRDSFDKCMDMLSLVNQNQSLVKGALGNRLNAKFMSKY